MRRYQYVIIGGGCRGRGARGSAIDKEAPSPFWPENPPAVRASAPLQGYMTGPDPDGVPGHGYYTEQKVDIYPGVWATPR